MSTYTVEITELVEHRITVEAPTPAAARAEAVEIRGYSTASDRPEIININAELAESELVR